MCGCNKISGNMAGKSKKSRTRKSDTLLGAIGGVVIARIATPYLATVPVIGTNKLLLAGAKIVGGYFLADSTTGMTSGIGMGIAGDGAAELVANVMPGGGTTGAIRGVGSAYYNGSRNRLIGSPSVQQLALQQQGARAPQYAAQPAGQVRVF